MKKFFLFIILAGLLFGAFIGIRTSVLNNENEEVKEVVVDNTYIGELLLPLIEIDTLNPILTNNKQVSDTLKLVYEPLFDFDNKNHLVSALGLDYMEKDEHTWIVTLRKDVSWHSGKVFSADDVIFTINSIKANPQSIYTTNLKNVNYAEKTDDYSVAIYLNERDMNFAYKLTFPIIPDYYFRDSLSDTEKCSRPVGTGPYKYVSSDDDTITLKFNDDWWKDVNARLDTIYLKKYQSYGEAIKAFKSSEIDLITTSMTSWEKKFGVIGINSYRYENEKFDTLIPNCERTILKDSSVRRAILYSINRENIIDEVFENNAIKQDILIHSNSYLADNSQEIEFNTDKAKQLLNNSSWKFSNNSWTKVIDGRTYTLRLNLMVNKDSSEKKEAAQKIKENLESMGIKITISEVDANTYNKNIANKNFDLAYGTIETNNEFDILELMYSKNYANYNSELINESLSQLYLANINLGDAFKDLQKNYKNEVPYIGLYYRTNTLLTNKAVKGNITPTISNPYFNIWSWSK